MWKQMEPTAMDGIMVVRNDGTWVKLSKILEGNIVLVDCQDGESNQSKQQETKTTKRNCKRAAPRNLDKKETPETDKAVDTEGHKSENEKPPQEPIDAMNIWKDGKVQFSYDEMVEQLTRDCKDPKEVIRMKGIVKSDKAVILKKKFGWAADHIALELGIKRESVIVYLYNAKKAGKL